MTVDLTAADSAFVLLGGREHDARQRLQSAGLDLVFDRLAAQEHDLQAGEA